MTRGRVVWQVILAWIPVWGVYTLMIGPANPLHRDSSVSMAAAIAFRAITIAALLGLLVSRYTNRVRWRPSQPLFVVAHVAGAVLFAVSWFALCAIVEDLLRPGMIHGYMRMLGPNLALGLLLYVMIAGTTYAARAAKEAARAEAAAARSQLAALRAQLNPHFLFNALHTVVHLVPRDPGAASRAAEQVASLLRTTIEEDRDVVSLKDECDFVTRYLDVERLRFGDRLRVEMDVPDEAQGADVPAFALQALVENAVRHGAAPRVDPTTISITARRAGERLRLVVLDDGQGATPDTLGPAGPNGSGGTGLRRLRERLDALYRGAASLTVAPRPGGGVSATLDLPADDA